MAVRYAARHGLDLDDRLKLADKGISAFRGRNVVEGKLGLFLEHVKSGEVPEGSYLLVESLDRITRQQVAEAQLAFLNILKAGVTLVTLMDERVYTWATANSDMVQLIISLAILSRGHEESATKSRRLKEAWEGKRAQATSKPLTSKAPAWLRLNSEVSRFELIEERAKVVERIFALTLEGVGQHKIAETFNREGLKPWGRGQHWQRSYIAKVLSNPAAIGTIVPHQMEHEGGLKRRRPLQPVENYYPPVVPKEVFDDVQALQKAKTAPTRGRHAHAPISNILAGLAACPQCGRTMTRVQKGKRSKPSFVCTAAKAGAGCAYKSVPYLWVEGALLRGLSPRLLNHDGVEANDELEQEIVNAEHVVEALAEEIELLADNLAQVHSRTLATRLRQTETRREETLRHLQALHDRRSAASGLSIGARVTKAVAALQPTDGVLDRAEANLALRTIFKRAVINWPEGVIELEWTHGGVCEVPYAWVAR